MRYDNESGYSLRIVPLVVGTITDPTQDEIEDITPRADERALNSG